MERYLPDADYNALVERLTPPGTDPDQVKLALGEIGNVWPESIRADAEASC